MSKKPFRTAESTPKREYSGREYANYRSYKKYLREDFREKCGYTNCLDHWFGGINTFQIDHFLPQSKYPELINKYDNLIYCCSYVNRAKSNEEGEFLDPCESDYNEHFYRNALGEIIPVSGSKAAKFMHKELKLYLKRYSFIWMLEQLEERMFKLQKLIEKYENEEVKELFIEITMKYNDYKRYLRAHQ